MKLTKEILILTGCILIASGCSKSDSPIAEKKVEAPPTPIAIDLSTPDKALKSYWAVKDSVDLRQRAVYEQMKAKLLAESKQIGDVTEGTLAKQLIGGDSLAELETYSRDLLDVKVESESRAVIVAVIKNTTPVPAGAEMPEHAEERRRNGDRYRYVLEKTQTGWRVAEIWERETYPREDWKKSLPRPDKPRANWVTWGGR
jgi:hypothetical protein